ncbi:MAG: hypothetical protein SGPRY_002149 [Prymnesium sp.]
MRSKTAHIASLADKLAAFAKSSPPPCDPYPVIQALTRLEEGLSGDGKPHSLTLSSLEGENLPPPLVAFVGEHTPVAVETGALQPHLFAPFPLDNGDVAPRPLPEGCFDRQASKRDQHKPQPTTTHHSQHAYTSHHPFLRPLSHHPTSSSRIPPSPPPPRSPFLTNPTCLSWQAHGWSVLEHLNRVRSDPKAYAAHLRSRLKGCFEGKVFTPPWPGSKVLTSEGQAALDSLFLETTAPLPEVRLVPQLVDAAFESTVSLVNNNGSLPPLDQRLAKYGTWSGVAGEAIVYGSIQPEAVVVQLLLSDGDADRRNRDFLMHHSVKVAGFAMNDHKTHGSVGIISLFTLFVKSLSREVSVTCQGIPSSAEFDEVLDAVPSDQAREIALNGLSQGKEVTLDYTISQLTITVKDQDGKRQQYTMPLK